MVNIKTDAKVKIWIETVTKKIKPKVKSTDTFEITIIPWLENKKVEVLKPVLEEVLR